jgi:DNA-binding CsgD family transcriptional regulator
MGERPGAAVLAASYRLDSLQAVAAEVLPALADALGANFLFLHHGSSSEDASVVTWPPADDLLARYQKDYVADCPFEVVKSESNDRVLPITRRLSRKSLVRSAFYADLLRPAELEHHVALRLNPSDNDVSAARTGIMICRDGRAGEFTDEDLRLLSLLQPALRRSCQRAGELHYALQRIDALEAILSQGGSHLLRLAIDADGRELHLQASTTMDATVLATVRDASHPLRRLARDVARGTSVPKDVDATLTPVLGSDGSVFIAEVTLVPPTLGLHSMAILTLTPKAPGKAHPGWGLSRTEAVVLREIVAGGTNSEIGRRLFISPETVRTHLTRIYRKMGVRSRLEAAALARSS